MAYIGREPIYGVFQKQTITPTGATTYNLDYAVSSATSILVSVGGVIQNPITAYDVNIGGTQIIFSEAPDTSADVYIIFLGERYTVPTLGANTVVNSMITDNTIASAKLTTTGVTAAVYGNATNISSVEIDAAGRITSASNVSLITGVTATTYGGATAVPVVTVDATGRITSASNAAITAGISTGKAIAMSMIFGF